MSIGKKKLNNNRAFTQPFLKSCLSLERAGFTLIELILTAAIVLVIIGLSIPVFKNVYSDLRINLQAQDITALINLAREKAVMTRAPHAIELDINQKTYRMVAIDSEKNEIIQVKDRWGKRFLFPGNFKVTSTNNLVKFFPDGTSNGVSISLEDETGTKKQIQVNDKTGEIIVVEEKKK